MNLLTHIKRQRKQQRKKQTLRRNVFNQISTIVKRYRLKTGFLDILDNVEDDLSEKIFNLTRIRVKAPLDGPLFSLATKDEYSLTMSIIDKIDNPYLRFAHSPKEILLCRPLYHHNPALAPEKLMRYHFETLLLHERAKIKKTENTCHKGTKTQRV